MKYPEMVKTNARYRGPRESRKQNNIMRNIHFSTGLLKDELNRHRAERKSIASEIFKFYNEDQHQSIKDLSSEVNALKGGE